MPLYEKYSVIMLPTVQDNLVKDMLFKHTSGVINIIDYTPKFNSETERRMTPQHLYFVSKNLINEPINHTKDFNWYKPYKGFKPYKRFNIVASTDTSLGLPFIPKSFTRKYVDTYGKIEEVELEVISATVFRETGFYNVGKMKPNKNFMCEVIIKDEAFKDISSKKDVKDIENFTENDVNNAIGFSKWLLKEGWYYHEKTEVWQKNKPLEFIEDKELYELWLLSK